MKNINIEIVDLHLAVLQKIFENNKNVCFTKDLFLDKAVKSL